MHELGALKEGSGAHPAPVPFAPQERRRSTLARWFDNWMRSLGMAVVLFLLIRTFLVEAFQIPSGSMERTLLAGDFLFVNKAVYGAQIPGTHARLPGFTLPQRGDVIVFEFPKDPTLNYVKRVIGTPGGGLFQLRSGSARSASLVDGDTVAPARLADPLSRGRGESREEVVARGRRRGGRSRSVRRQALPGGTAIPCN